MYVRPPTDSSISQPCLHWELFFCIRKHFLFVIRHRWLVVATNYFMSLAHAIFVSQSFSQKKKSAKLASSFAAAPASAILARLLFGLSVYSWPSRWGQTRRCRLKLFSVDREPSSRESSWRQQGEISFLVFGHHIYLQWLKLATLATLQHVMVFSTLSELP